jgi:replicative DNA helicase
VAARLTKEGTLGRAGGVGALHDLVDAVPTAANAGYYAGIVRGRAILRRLIDAGTRITQLGFSTDGEEVPELVNRAQAEVFAVTERESNQDYVSIGAMYPEFVDRLHDFQKGIRHQGVLTGFGNLDHITGGLQPGQMVILAARPAMGKSTLGLDFVRAASIRQGLTSVIFSLEMSRAEIAQRLVSAESGVLLEKIRRGNVDPDDWVRIAQSEEGIINAPLFIDDSPNLNLVEIRAKCRRLKQRHNLKLVVVDYLQLMSSGKRVDSRQQEVSEFSRALKLLAKELEVPIVAISQLNRNPEKREDRKPQMSDLRESGSLEQDADVVILVHRPEAGNREMRGQTEDAELLLAKHRNGPTGTIPVLFLGHRAKFTEPAEDL